METLVDKYYTMFTSIGSVEGRNLVNHTACRYFTIDERIEWGRRTHEWFMEKIKGRN